MEKTDNEEEMEFNEEFGSFIPESVKSGPLAKINQQDKTRTQPCMVCGRYPRTHVVNFIDKAAHPKNVYIDCKCGECDGKWYADEEEAIMAWNSKNLGAIPKDPKKEDMVDFYDKVMENYKIPN